jgi:hypothetical protein
MEQTKNQALKVTAEFDKLNNDVTGIIKGIDSTLNEMDLYEKSHTSKLQIDMGNLDNFRLRVKRQSMFSGAGGGWMVSFLRLNLVVVIDKNCKPQTPAKCCFLPVILCVVASAQ